MPRRNAPENFFSAVRGCPRSCARTNPWFRGRILVRKNQPLVPRSNIAGSWTQGGGGYPPPRCTSTALSKHGWGVELLFFYFFELLFSWSGS